VRGEVAHLLVDAQRGGCAREIAVRVSIGVAAAGVGTQPLELLEAADSALYQAKAMGRNQVRLAPG